MNLDANPRKEQVEAQCQFVSGTERRDCLQSDSGLRQVTNDATIIVFEPHVGQ
jgi:hypothetical protein